MKLKTFIIGLIIIFVKCSGSKQPTKLDLQIPDKEEVIREGRHERFPGTRVCIVHPEGYVLLPSSVRFQKNDNSYFQTVEIPKTNYSSQKTSIKQAIEDAKSKGLNVYYEKEFRLGDNDAYLVYGKDSKPNLEQMVLVFGDADNAAMVAGELPCNDEKARREVLSALLTAYLDKSEKPENQSKFTR